MSTGITFDVEGTFAPRDRTPLNFIKNESAQKLRGGYYTPEDLALFIARWVGEIEPKHVLEPSCGDGAFFEALGQVSGTRKAKLSGFELSVEEAAKSRSRASLAGFSESVILSQDFLEWAVERIGPRSIAPLERFDAVVGNPPFVRYQYLPGPFQARAEEVFRALGLPFTKHTNAWVPFVLASVALLRPGGRLAMVVPSEIIHVTHAQSVRTYLGRECRRMVLIDPEEIWFSDTLQGAVILLAEKKGDPGEESDGLGTYPVRAREFTLLEPSSVFNAPATMNGQTAQGKWTRAFLDRETRDLFNDLSEHKKVHRFEDIAQVDVGIVTGANKFFLVSDEVVARNGLQKWAHPMFGRSEHCPGVIYDARQHASNVESGLPTNFLWFSDDAAITDPAAEAYIRTGEQEELQTRYKCRIRKPWYRVPSVSSTEIGLLKRSHDTPRLILNRLGAYTTDTAYRIRARGVDPERLVACFMNPLTALSAELEGRHYGGGVLELIPSEIERLIVPLPAGVEIDISALDTAVRTKPAERVLADAGRIVLGGLGLSSRQQTCVLDGWRKLRDRRQRTTSGPS